MVRVLNILLLAIAIVGVYYVTQINSEYEAARSEYRRLSAKVGRMPIGDATKVHIVALDTEQPLDFAWQFYVPPDFESRWQSVEYQGGSSTSTGKSSTARTEIVRVRFRKIDGQWHVWRKFINSSGSGGVNYSALLDQPELLSIQQLGREGIKVCEPDEVLTLLEISTGPSHQPTDIDQLLLVRFGSKDAWEKQQSQGN